MHRGTASNSVTETELLENSSSTETSLAEGHGKQGSSFLSKSSGPTTS